MKAWRFCDRCRSHSGEHRNGYRRVDGQRVTVYLCGWCEALLRTAGLFWCIGCKAPRTADDRYRAEHHYCRTCKRAASRADYARNQEAHRDSARRYHEAHREAILERVRQAYYEHRERRRAYRAAHRAQRNARERAYYQRNRERLQERSRARRAANPERYREHQRIYHHRRKVQIFFGRRAI